MFRGNPKHSVKRDDFFEEFEKAFDHEVKKQKILNDPELNDIIYSGEIAPYMMVELIARGVIDPSRYRAKKRDEVSPSLIAEMVAEGSIDPGSTVVNDAVNNVLRLARETRTSDIPHMEGRSGWGLWRKRDELTTHQRINQIIQQLTNYNYELGRKELNSTMNDNEKNPMPEEKPLTVNFRGIDIHLNEEEAVKLMGDLAKEITKED